MKVRAACHCGAVTLEATLPNGLDPARCDCSFCARRGAAAVTAATDSVRVLTGADALATYAWNTGTARHHFCRICGIYTHHRRRSDPAETGINLGCIAGVDVRDHAPGWNDGRAHPSDAPDG